jgi:5'-3' exonuclease
MGIAGFTTWIKKRYPHAFATLPEDQRVDHVYIDLASTLHMVVRKSHTKAYFHKLLHKRLDEILAATHPTKRVVLALDGPAPLAKLLEQRCAPHCRAAGTTEAAGTAPPGRRRRPQRRRLWPLEAPCRLLTQRPPARPRCRRRRRREAFKDTNSKKKKKRLAMSSLALTTGTPLMLEIHQSLMLYICHRLADPATRHLQFELSDSTVKASRPGCREPGCSTLASGGLGVCGCTSHAQPCLRTPGDENLVLRL